MALWETTSTRPAQDDSLVLLAASVEQPRPGKQLGSPSKVRS